MIVPTAIVILQQVTIALELREENVDVLLYLRKNKRLIERTVDPETLSWEKCLASLTSRQYNQ